MIPLINYASSGNNISGYGWSNGGKYYGRGCGYGCHGGVFYNYDGNNGYGYGGYEGDREEKYCPVIESFNANERN